MAGKSATPNNKRLEDMDAKLEDLQRELVINKESFVDLSFKVTIINNKLDDNILSITNRLDDYNNKLNENNNKLDENNLENNKKFEELKLMILNLNNNFLSSNIYSNPGKSQGELKSLPQELLNDMNAEDSINEADNACEDIKELNVMLTENNFNDDVFNSMASKRNTGNFSAFSNQTPVSKSSEWKDNVNEINESNFSGIKLKEIPDFQNNKEKNNNSGDTSKMQGMFPMIIKMFNRNRNNAEDNNKNFKLEACKEEYLMNNISENSFKNIVDWMYTIMRVKSDYPNHRIVLSKALDDSSINAICSFFAAKCCVAVVSRVGKGNKNSGKIIDYILWCLIKPFRLSFRHATFIAQLFKLTIVGFMYIKTLKILCSSYGGSRTNLFILQNQNVKYRSYLIITTVSIIISYANWVNYIWSLF
jgi:hypothetical protein